MKNKKNKKIIVGYTTGVFDLFHIGHLNILKNAKAKCDKLIVGVSTDELTFAYKNKKPVIKYRERLEIIKSVKYADIVVPQTNLDKVAAWKKLKFDVVFVGNDWYKSSKWQLIEKDLAKVGVKVIYLPYTKTTSSTIIREILQKIIGDLK